MMRGNLHTHSVYCDGKSTPEEIVSAAILKGFDYIGFSGHGYTGFDLSYCMKKEKDYIKEISSLKEKYKGKIKIFCGVERDLFSDSFENNFDYEIASVHYVKVGEKYFDVDESISKQRECIKECFGGDVYAYAEAYYKETALLKGDIIGHFDLITKFDAENTLFSPKEERYKKAVLSALDTLAEKNTVFEVNTGAMARGFKRKPYPDIWILEEIKRRDGRVLITSDCHEAQKLDFGYNETEKILASMGFEDFYSIDAIVSKEY